MRELNQAYGTRNSDFVLGTAPWTMDAIFLARRLVENANAVQESPLILLALDWAKAFDSICPRALIEGLKRVGVPLKMLNV